MNEPNCYHKINLTRLEKLIAHPKETPARLDFHLYLLNGRGCGNCAGTEYDHGDCFFYREAKVNE